MSLDPDDPEEGAIYWNYNIQTSGENDIPAFVTGILEDRSDSSLECKKVTIFSSSQGAQETTIMASSFPNDTADKVAQIVNVVPCWVPTEQRLLEALGLAGRRRLSHDTDWWGSWAGANSCKDSLGDDYVDYEPRDYSAYFREARINLSYEDYHEFNNQFRQWKRDVGKCWKNSW